MKDDILSLLGLMRRASALSIGEDDTMEAVAKGRARLLLLPQDGREKTAVRAERSLEGHSARMIVLPFPEEDLAKAVSTARCSMASITDLGFAKALLEKLEERYPGRYEADLEEISRRHGKIQRRKKEKPGVRTKKKSSGEE